jgi:hypothetical protein
LLASAEEFAMIDNAAGNHQHVVAKSNLVISHEELHGFEKTNHGALGTHGAGVEVRQGAPARFDRVTVWVELCAVIYLERLPDTQAELVKHVANWLQERDKAVPGESTIKKTLRPLWQRLREPMDHNPKPAREVRGR